MHNSDSKNCPVCNRSFSLTKKLEATWSLIVYCSDECRRNKNKTDLDMSHEHEKFLHRIFSLTDVKIESNKKNQ